MRYTTLPLAFFLLGVAGHTGAQTPPVKLPAKTPAPLTLAQALAKMPPPTKGILLIVGADKTALPDGTLPPPADASVTVLANTFGDETQDFGSVTAIAPFTRVLLNADPAPPDLSVDIGAQGGFKMLAASLSDAQWKALTSEDGLGLPDLTDDTQRRLFHTLFPHGQLWVASQDPAQAKMPEEQRTDTRNVSDQIDGVRVRLGQTSHVYVHDKKGEIIFFSGPDADPTQLRVWHPKFDPAVTRYNILLRAVVPNTSKSSDLSLSDARFQQTVALTGAKTVGDLVARIAAKTHTELYADPHYALRLLTVIGPASDVSAAEMLKALALAVAGTYRQVGPAFVLTDDLEGVGTRRKRLTNWVGAAYQSYDKLEDLAGATLLKLRVSQLRSLPAFGDPLAITSDQMKSFNDERSASGIPEFEQDFPFAKLNPAQQNQARRAADAYEDQPDAKAANDKDDDVPREPDPTGLVTMFQSPQVQIIVPTVNGIVETELSSTFLSLYWPGAEVLDARQATAAKAAPSKKLPPALPLMPLLHSHTHRAVIGHPTTPAAVDALIAAMQKLGLNELWLDVFSEGKSRLANKGTDILTEALKQTQGTGIAVYADLSLLSWGYAPPKDTWDLDILGENSHQSMSYDAEGLPYPAIPPPVSASPVSATVKKTLMEMVRGVASRPGLAGFVWEDAVIGIKLGYTPAMRLAFLRAFHADPVDITDIWYNDNFSLPTFDDSTAEDALIEHWAGAIFGANALLLTELRQAVPATAEKPILIDRTDSYPHALTTWDDSQQRPPALPPPGSAAVVKRGQSALVRVTIKDAADTDALARSLDTLLPPPAKDNAARDGYVLDFEDNHITDGTDPLRDLVRAAGPKL